MQFSVIDNSDHVNVECAFARHNNDDDLIIMKPFNSSHSTLSLSLYIGNLSLSTLLFISTCLSVGLDCVI